MAEERKKENREKPADQPAEKAPGKKPRKSAQGRAEQSPQKAAQKGPETATAKTTAETTAKAADESSDEKAKEPQAKAPARRRRAPARRRGARERPTASERDTAAPPVVRVRARYVRSSARKARLVIEHIRGKPVVEARAILRHTPRGVARDLEKLLASAVANAENNHELVGDDLVVKEAYADEGPTLKRFRPRALGRATRIRKRTSHLTLTLIPKE